MQIELVYYYICIIGADFKLQSFHLMECKDSIRKQRWRSSVYFYGGRVLPPIKQIKEG